MKKISSELHGFFILNLVRLARLWGEHSINLGRAGMPDEEKLHPHITLSSSWFW